MNYVHRDCWHMCKYADRNFTYIEIPKAGCSTIKHQMSAYFKERLDKPPVPATSELTKFMGYSRGILPSDHNSLVFTVVRDPISRFISGIKMLAKINHNFLPSKVKEAYNVNSQNPNWFLPFLEQGLLAPAMQETHMTPIDFCIGNYLSDIEYACSLENIGLLQDKLNTDCGTNISFGHLFQSSLSCQPTLEDKHLDILLNEYGLDNSYSLIKSLSKLHSAVIDYNPTYWLLPEEKRQEHYA